MAAERPSMVIATAADVIDRKELNMLLATADAAGAAIRGEHLTLEDLMVRHLIPIPAAVVQTLLRATGLAIPQPWVVRVPRLTPSALMLSKEALGPLAPLLGRHHHARSSLPLPPHMGQAPMDSTNVS